MPEGAEVRYSGLTELKGPEDFSECIEAALLQILEARLDAEADAVVISLPRMIAAGREE